MHESENYKQRIWPLVLIFLVVLILTGALDEGRDRERGGRTHRSFTNADVNKPFTNAGQANDGGSRKDVILSARMENRR